ncbi:MAG TPA: carboxypeptidase-like regulatory domain-containing protein [Gaiellaceae bacterium]
MRSDANGSYHSNLSPGRYLLVVEKPAYPAQKASRATVEEGIVTLTDLFVDTGIR